ncbi:MAG: zinc ribbon domain-containing protein [Clostridia bacterium]|nr:zinc ribbon domain-containing protein [Clostridia bacterium]
MDENNLNQEILNEEELLNDEQTEAEVEILTEEIPQNEEKKLCSFCGAELNDDDTFCIACGTKVASIPERTVSANPPVRAKIPSGGYASYTRRPMPKKTSANTVAYTVLAYVFWAVAVIFILNAMLTLGNASISGMQFFSTDYTDILIRIAAVVIYSITSLNFTVVGSVMFLLSKKNKK